jgi:formylglycine-generating enzyme required for sulfatase activity
MMEPTAVLTLTPIERAIAGVQSNAEWEPYIQEFDGIPMALVPAGCFMMGSQTGYSDTQPAHEICFDKPFWIDLYEVTNKQYGSQGYWAGDDIPRDQVLAVDAIAHCRSRGGRLPTEAEWEYAARGPDDLVYPWGNVFDGKLTNFCDTNCTFNSADRAIDDGYANPAPVGSYPGGVSWIGAYDLSGNVAEWVSSMYLDYPYDPNDGRELPDDSFEYRVSRGGSWESTADNMQSYNRGMHNPVKNFDAQGFRCARDYDG